MGSLNNFKKLRVSAGYSQRQLAEILFVNQTAVSQWERGATIPSPNILLRMCELYSTTTDYLLGRNEASKSRRGIKIPVLGSVQAGIPLEAIQDIIDYEEIAPELAATGDFFGLSIRGDSMEPRIRDGDVVIVRKQSDVSSGDTAVILVNGHDATVKKVLKRESGIMLQPTNPNHEPMFFRPEEICSLPVVILGKVIELRGKFA
ncbi:MAG: XRE family transcriptional regulator [Bacillota bacterium]|nr:XRE family transcriptional regulator [Bacillota bacterium]